MLTLVLLPILAQLVLETLLLILQELLTLVLLLKQMPVRSVQALPFT